MNPGNLVPILAAATASGKTEAAFLPILSRIASAPRDSIQALYISPLVALINDQFGRLAQLCEKARIAVHRRHGGILESVRHRLINRPSGVLLITPESFEACSSGEAARYQESLAAWSLW